MKFIQLISGFFRRCVTRRTEAASAARARWEREQQDTGAFDYEEGGFSYPFESGTRQVRWVDVYRILCYKLEIFAASEICLELHIRDRGIRFTESTPGWYQFTQRLQSEFPEIPNGWDWDVTAKTAGANYTVLYERKDYSLPDGSNFYASVRRGKISTVSRAFREQGWEVRKRGRDEVEARNYASELSISRDSQGVLLSGSIAIESGICESIERVLYGLGTPYQYEIYDAQKRLLVEKKWP